MAAAEENPYENVKKEDVEDVKKAVKLAETEFNKSNAGGWHVSSVQEYSRGAAAGSFTLKVVLCSGEQCQMKSCTVDTTGTGSASFAAKKKSALF